ncbi:MAG TPA: phytanoyl-CoA dioxygenase family protein [Pyrinomonadaceae bacterium]
MSAPETPAERVRREGFAVVPGVLCGDALGAFERSLEAVGAGEGVLRRGGVYAIRNLFEALPAARELARAAALRALVEPVLGAGCFAVRATLFDKTAAAPWKVAWHQDLSIAVRARREAEGFGPWTVKAGVVHVQPPARVLEGVLAVRLHLDDCDESNGPLRVLPGSHLCGRLGADEIRRWREGARAVTCVAPRGAALLLRPLLLHSSPTPRAPRRRRVVHVEYAAGPLPYGLEWRV